MRVKVRPEPFWNVPNAITPLLPSMILVHGKYIATVNLKIDGARRGPDERSHVAVSNRLSFNGIGDGTLIDEVGLRDNGTVV